MASLPAFHAFDEAATNQQHVSQDASMVPLMPEVKSQDPSMVGDAGGSSLGESSIQAGQAMQGAKAVTYNDHMGTKHDSMKESSAQSIQGTKTAAAQGSHDGNQGSIATAPSASIRHQTQTHISSTSIPAQDTSLDSSYALVSQRLMTQVNNTVNNTKDGINEDKLDFSPAQGPQVPEAPVYTIVDMGGGHVDLFPDDSQDASTALASLRAIANSEPSNPEDPAVAEILQRISDLKQQFNPAALKSDPRPAFEMPVVSVNITGSIIFVGARITYLVLRSAMLPAALAFILNLVFSPRSGIVPVSTAFMFFASVTLILTLFLVLLVRTIIQKNKAKFSMKAKSDLSKLPAASYLFVMGSGGHTTEMISLVKLSQKPSHNTHRRYLITAGDDHSEIQSIMLEEKISDMYPDGSAGTADIVTVTRARSVHQTYRSSVLTSLKCFIEITHALVTIPSARIGQPGAKHFQSPHVIVTNGPGTGFIVGLVAFFLKMFRVVPRDRLKVVFVETWARAHSLGLTGKLFELTHLADVFVVQSEGLAKAVNKPSIGNINKKWADLVNAAPSGVHGSEKRAE